MSVVVRVDKVTKEYHLGVLDRRSFFRDLRRNLLGRKQESAGEIFRALDDVSFDVRDGDVLGVLGRNGAGKSTLLKILSHITAPTTGRVCLKGRIASLLEVGTGFHPELTGRENVYLNGAILGMTRREIAGKFDEIAAFSGVEGFLDTPVKRYSSGMRVRLAFAVAAHLEPEILVIDEVLAVGDAAFQQRCLGKIGSIARAGRTVLFVSHNAAAVESLCTRGIVLEHGRLAFSGTQSEAIAYYSAAAAATGGTLRDREERSGSGKVRATSIDLRSPEGQPLGVLHSGQDVDVWIGFENVSGEPHPELNVRINVQTVLGLPVFTQSSGLMAIEFGALPASGYAVCRLPRLPLAGGAYRIDLEIYSAYRGSVLFDSLTNALEFAVEGGDFHRTSRVAPPRLGSALVEAEWRLEK